MARWLVLIPTLLLISPLAASAQDVQGVQGADVRVDVQVVLGVGGSGDPTEPRILTVRQPPRAPGPAELIVYEEAPPETRVIVVHALPVPEPTPFPVDAEAQAEHESIAWSRWGIFVEELSLSSLGLAFSDPEVNALEGSTAPVAEPWGSPIVGGFHFGGGARPLPWLRLPEFSLSIGGGAPDGEWVPMGEGDFQARLTSMVLLRAEVAGGVEVDLGPLRPFAMARIGVAGYFVDVDVVHGELGSLGTETLSSAQFETGFDVGVAFRIGEDVHLTATWRETFGDSRWRGGLIGLAAGLDGD
ncbi:MAG: hypothetical protein DRJ42_26915 [Deltaproteobacteria bacterium]|nr:MAG: hypothetical protein DRJ42_26915 [Deltaproteobacteria bacterium]